MNKISGLEIKYFPKDGGVKIFDPVFFEIMSIAIDRSLKEMVEAACAITSELLKGLKDTPAKRQRTQSDGTAAQSEATAAAEGSAKAQSLFD